MVERGWTLAVFTVLTTVGGAFVGAGALAKDNWSPLLVSVGIGGMVIGLTVGLIALTWQVVTWVRGATERENGPPHPSWGRYLKGYT